MGETFVIPVSGMTCNSCAGRVKEALEGTSGVISADVNLDSGKASISADGIERSALEDAICEAGYSIGEEMSGFDWKDGPLWRQSAHNTKWCLIGCSIGDFGTIAAFQFIPYLDALGWSTMSIMLLAMFNGIMTSIALETAILMKQMSLREAFRVAIGMSLISMLGMEAAMNLTDLLLTGGAMLTWWVVPIMLIVGFLTPWPYNYWRLKKYGKACH